MKITIENSNTSEGVGFGFSTMCQRVRSFGFGPTFIHGLFVFWSVVVHGARLGWFQCGGLTHYFISNDTVQ